MVYSTKRGTGVIGTLEQPLEPVTFEATIEHGQSAILSFIAKARTLSGKSLADHVGQSMVLQIDDGPALAVVIVHIEGEDAVLNLAPR
ncbi:MULTISPECIES: hypothetical protein [Phenylobacterium]|uniref:Uncharacterized protein n=1 Tax=Phenylobacterium koreense TaxID=266125 RepID=A0ABV2EI74_9CAUL